MQSFLIFIQVESQRAYVLSHNTAKEENTPCVHHTYRTVVSPDDHRSSQDDLVVVQTRVSTS